MIALSVAQSFNWILIHNAILFIDTSTMLGTIKPLDNWVKCLPILLVMDLTDDVVVVKLECFVNLLISQKAILTCAADIKSYFICISGKKIGEKTGKVRNKPSKNNCKHQRSCHTLPSPISAQL